MIWTTRIKSPAALRIIYNLHVSENGLPSKIQVFEPKKNKEEKEKSQ
jgi:hypothetical protein